MWNENNCKEIKCRKKFGVYIDDILYKLHLTHLKSAPSPCVVASKLSLTDVTSLMDSFLYRSMIGTLQYLTTTRPDIAYVVNHLSQFLKSSTYIQASNKACTSIHIRHQTLK